jgi:hypothetical protein
MTFEVGMALLFALELVNIYAIYRLGRWLANKRD